MVSADQQTEKEKEGQVPTRSPPGNAGFLFVFIRADRLRFVPHQGQHGLEKEF